MPAFWFFCYVFKLSWRPFSKLTWLILLHDIKRFGQRLWTSVLNYYGQDGVDFFFRKMTTTIFWNGKGDLTFNFIKRSVTITADIYCETIKLRHVILKRETVIWYNLNPWQQILSRIQGLVTSKKVTVWTDWLLCNNTPLCQLSSTFCTKIMSKFM